MCSSDLDWLMELPAEKDKFGGAGVRLIVKVRAISALPRLRMLARVLIKDESLQAFRDLLD